MEYNINSNEIRSVNNTYDMLFSIYRGSSFKLLTVAREFDTAESRAKFDHYYAARLKLDKPSAYPIVATDLYGLGLSSEQIDRALQNLNLLEQYLSETVLNGIMDKYRQVVIDSYVEESSYYRMLMGLPTLDDVTNIYVDSSWDDRGVDSTKPIHTMLDSELFILYNGGALTALAEEYPNKFYIQYLHRRGDVLELRMGGQFDLVHIGDGDMTTKTLFESTYNSNKRYFMKVFYNDYYAKVNTYYEQLMVTYLVWQTIADCARELMGGIEIDFLSESDVNNVFSDHMIPDLGIPLKIKSEVAKVMNNLIRYKGSVKTIMDIAKIFNIGSVYKYIIQKQWVDGIPTLRAKKVQLDNSDIKEVLSNEGAWITFDELVSGDPRWTNSNDNYHDKIIANDFTYIETKYITVENAIDLNRLSIDLSSFFAYLLKHPKLANALVLTHKQANIDMELIDVYSFMTALLFARYGFSDDIPSTVHEVDYITNNKVWGVNDIKITEIPVLRHEWKKIMFDTPYVNLLEGFVEVNQESTFGEFVQTYSTDKLIIDTIIDINQTTEDTHVRDLTGKVLDVITKLNVNIEVFGTAKTYTEYLQNNNPTLYNRLKVIEASPTASDEASTEINNMIGLLEEVLTGYDSNNIFWFYEGLGKLEFAETKALLTQIIFYFKSRNVDLKDVDMVLNVIDEDDNTYRITEMLSGTDFKTGEDDYDVVDNINISSQAEFEMEVLYIGESLLELTHDAVSFRRII